MKLIYDMRLYILICRNREMRNQRILYPLEHVEVVPQTFLVYLVVLLLEILYF